MDGSLTRADCFCSPVVNTTFVKKIDVQGPSKSTVISRVSPSLCSEREMANGEEEKDDS